VEAERVVTERGFELDVVAELVEALRLLGGGGHGQEVGEAVCEGAGPVAGSMRIPTAHS